MEVMRGRRAGRVAAMVFCWVLLAPAGAGAAGPGVYVTNAGAGTVSQYDVDACGRLAPAATATAGARPVDLEISPDGGSAYVVNGDSATVSQYNIGPDRALAPKTVAAADVGKPPRGDGDLARRP